MSAASTISELEEARVHLQSLIERLSGKSVQEDEDFALSIDFGHIIEHINLAWHYRRMSNREADQLSQNSFEKYSKAIPNFGYEMKLLNGLDFDES